MVKKVKKIILLGVVLIMVAGLFVGCSNDYHDDRVNVTIRAEFRDRFLAEEFSVEDFAWDNVDEIEYEGWVDIISRGLMTVRLSNHGRKRVRDAIVCILAH